MKATYAGAGVDIPRADSLVRHIRKAVRSTYSKKVLGDIGSFGAFFDARFEGYKFPVLVSSVDGVGTKLKVAQLLDKHDTIGQDLVNHCVNDIAVCGATPLYFMDYFATGKLKEHVATDVIDGFVRACRENGCALTGGETAEMPGFYDNDEYDLGGTIVGVVEKREIIDGRSIHKGDVLVGLSSTGLHTNGYSLARQVLLDRFGLSDHIDELGCTLGEELLKTHRSYLRAIRSLIKKFTVRGLAHITGGGIVGNTMRVIPRKLTLNIDWQSWERPSIFKLIQRVGNVPEKDMQRTFNLGVGLVAILPRKELKEALAYLRKRGEVAWWMGTVTTRS